MIENETNYYKAIIRVVKSIATDSYSGFDTVENLNKSNVMISLIKF